MAAVAENGCNDRDSRSFHALGDMFLDADPLEPEAHDAAEEINVLIYSGMLVAEFAVLADQTLVRIIREADRRLPVGGGIAKVDIGFPILGHGASII
jgi:hypothetical protein